MCFFSWMHFFLDLIHKFRSKLLSTTSGCCAWRWGCWYSTQDVIFEAHDFRYQFLRNNFWGKTSLVRRYMYDTFEEGTAPTVGAGNLSKTTGNRTADPLVIRARESSSIFVRDGLPKQNCLLRRCGELRGLLFSNKKETFFWWKCMGDMTDYVYLYCMYIFTVYICIHIFFCRKVCIIHIVTIYHVLILFLLSGKHSARCHPAFFFRPAYFIFSTFQGTVPTTTALGHGWSGPDHDHKHRLTRRINRGLSRSIRGELNCELNWFSTYHLCHFHIEGLNLTLHNLKFLVKMIELQKQWQCKTCSFFWGGFRFFNPRNLDFSGGFDADHPIFARKDSAASSRATFEMPRQRSLCMTSPGKRPSKGRGPIPPFVQPLVWIGCCVTVFVGRWGAGCQMSEQKEAPFFVFVWIFGSQVFSEIGT